MKKDIMTAIYKFNLIQASDKDQFANTYFKDHLRVDSHKIIFGDVKTKYKITAQQYWQNSTF